MPQDLYAPSLLEPSLANHFRVTFFFKNMAGYITLPVSLFVDAAFQNISGLSRELNVAPQSEGGENCRNNYLSTKISHGSLTLERGVMTVTPMAAQFEHMMRGGTPVYCNVFTRPLGEQLTELNALCCSVNRKRMPRLATTHNYIKVIIKIVG